MTRMRHRQSSLGEFAKAYPDRFNILLMDNADAHTAQSLRIPENIGLLFQPPRCPELNPAERVWQDLRSKLAWQRFAHIEALEDDLIAQLAQYRPAALKSLAGYPYLVQAYHAACL
ncbi:putative transposase, orfB [Roseiflexus castenholzii DSM 13941]|uniref:Putative transposase, orfB n=2 Tax=Roseiflexus castenholzii TaxID=120962 RepID=A7NIT3_ROSCS|nr:putative transposase, orfB [Roseiflexus castenholzii DSM 13941]